MKQELMRRIASVINALNNVSVKGEENLANMSGSITVLRETLGIISGAEFAENKESIEVE